jgi:Hint domain
MTDFNIPQGQTQTVGDLDGNVGTIQGNADGTAYGAGGGTLDEDHDWNGGTATVDGGTLEVDHDANGTTVNLDNATFYLATHDANGATINFTGGVNQFEIGSGSHIAQAGNLEGVNITGFAQGDRIVFDGDTTDASTPTYSGGVLSFDIGGMSYSINVSLAGGAPTSFNFGTLADGSIYVVDGAVCFLAGTRILTPRGEIAVENLAVGDDVVTHTKAGLQSKPIVWIGSRSVRANSLAPDEAYPVRIRAHAFGDGVPHRDLLVTPEHSVFVNGGLIPARMLVNGGSIIVDRSIDAYTFYHVELEQHSILLAEGLTTESYLDTGNRANFANADAPWPAARRRGRSWCPDGRATGWTRR